METRTAPPNHEPTSNTPANAPDREAAAKLGWGEIAFIGFLMLVGATLFVWTGYKFFTKPEPPQNIAADANRYLRFRKGDALSGPLQELLNDPDEYFVESQEHPLLGKPAPDFMLRDVDGKAVRLSRVLEKGPVVLVFYYGYWCDHCVAQLFGLDEDLGKFGELGASVVAMSADPPEQTRERYEQYGAFHFPVLSDADNRIAEKYGVYELPKTPEEKRGHLWHGTFVIGQNGTVRWAELGEQPFLHNKTLLREVALDGGFLQEDTISDATSKPQD
ncbi:Thiol-disulfide oxidoreductase ResA [Planctomycetes bacterium Pan216]|uniref:Thiol-disulfide oxidoreductase ResA n=1 Tax=Kolteria novifilia TaxID=2527975 RepID=A0A518BCG3_9BACT|nr:Thiol-disulfide oxidoreductase ResA [Planctomycetes bacterium Pan216]